MNSSSVTSINIVSVMGSCQATPPDSSEERPDREQTPQFFEYVVGTNQLVSVESTATAMMDEVSRFPVRAQAYLFSTILDALKKPGEWVKLEGDKKRRGARAVLLLSNRLGVFELLITH